MRGLSNAGGFKILVEDRAGVATPQQVQAATAQLIAEARKNPQLSLEEYDFLKSQATLVKEMSPSAQRGTKITYSGDLVDGVALISFNSSGASLSNRSSPWVRRFRSP